MARISAIGALALAIISGISRTLCIDIYAPISPFISSFLETYCPLELLQCFKGEKYEILRFCTTTGNNKVERILLVETNPPLQILEQSHK